MRHFSETTVYTFVRQEDDKYVLKTGNNEIYVTKEYVDLFMIDTDSVTKTEKVTLTKLREIFEAIPEKAVFTVVFRKKGISSKEAIKAINQAKNSKKSISEAAIAAIHAMEGEERILKGHKINTVSGADGLYDVIDLDVTVGHNQRKVNPQTITSLIYKGIEYILK